MQAQQMKCAESKLENSYYCWLRKRKPALLWLSPGDEFKIRQALHKVSRLYIRSQLQYYVTAVLLL